MTGRGWEMLGAVILAGLVAYGWRAKYRPWSPCRWCRGRGRVGSAQRWRPCSHCNGSGRRMTWGARMVRRGRKRWGR